MNFKKRVNGSWVDIPYYIHKTATDTFTTLPITIYADGTAITSYTIKGNTVQNGTPTPSNPVDVNGVGERTINLLNPYSKATNQDGAERFGGEFPAGTYYIYNGFSQNIYYRDGVSTMASSTVYKNGGSVIVTATDALVVWHASGTPTPTIMVAESSVAVPFEPYGYKIPILTNQQTTNIYLGSTQTTRYIKKLVLTGEENWYKSNVSGGSRAYFATATGTAVENAILCTHFETKPIYTTNDNIGITIINQGGIRIRTADIVSRSVTDFKSYLSDQYAAGTPVCVWYVLATPETAVVNEPLMKIGDYADTLSNATSIPTTDGANTITVDTTVQPSEFSATWTGWHNAEVKEKSENLFDDEIESGFYNDNGELVPDTTTSHSTTYIPVDGTTYTISGLWASTTNFAVYEWDNNKNWLRRSNRQVPASITLTFSIGSDAAFFTLQIRTEHGNIMLNTGSTALPYEPYWK